MTKENRKFTETVMACPALLVSMVWISDGTCDIAHFTFKTLGAHCKQEDGRAAISDAWASDRGGELPAIQEDPMTMQTCDAYR